MTYSGDSWSLDFRIYAAISAQALGSLVDALGVRERRIVRGPRWCRENVAVNTPSAT